METWANHLRFLATPEWHTAFPGAIVAALVMLGVANPPVSQALEEAKRTLEAELAAKWAGTSRAELRADPVLAVYDAYYKRFGQNYHVQMQIESVALKGKPIPSRAALVEAMFMAELATGILTAVHDLDRIEGDVVVDVATGEEVFARYDGAAERCKAGDMYMRDQHGVLTSIAQGPTSHGLATPETTAALFCLYAPAGIPLAAVEAHLDLLERNARLIAPAAVTLGQTVIEARNDH